MKLIFFSETSSRIEKKRQQDKKKLINLSVFRKPSFKGNFKVVKYIFFYIKFLMTHKLI